jgi:hypothetical protein
MVPDFNIDKTNHQTKIEEFNKSSLMLGDLVNDHLKKLSKTDKNYNKKCLEICHVGKFLLLINNNYSIESVTEKPDFIITESTNSIGLEHCVIVDNEYKKKEGTARNLFEKAEVVYRQRFPDDKFLANIWLKKNEFHIKKVENKIIIKDIVRVVNHYFTTRELLKIQIIDRLSVSFHTEIAFIPNFGAWCQQYLSEEELRETIRKKEKLFTPLQPESNLKEQWLLMVVGGVGHSSYRVRENFNLKVESQFDRIFLMEDFDCKIYQLK